MAELTSTKIYGDLQIVRDVLTNTLTVTHGAVINEGGDSGDFRVEADGETHMLFVDSGEDRVGIATSTPAYTFDVTGTGRYTGKLYTASHDAAGTIRSTVQIAPTTGAGLEMLYTGGQGYLHSYDRDAANYNNLLVSGASLNLRGYSGTGSMVSMVNITGGDVVVNEDSNDVDFRVENATYQYGLYMRGSDGKVGMGEMSNETEATYKMLNLRFYEDNSGAKLTSVGAVASNDGMLIYNDYTVTGHSSIDFVVDTNYPTSYNAGRFGWYGYGTTVTSTSYNYFFWTGYSGAAHWETMRLHRLGDLYVRSDVVAYSTVITSDERLKKNIENINNNTLDKLMQLRPVSFEWKDESKRGDARVSGLIAQEVELIFPELISESPNLDDGSGEIDETKYKHVRYNELVPYLTKGIQEQQQLIDNQQKEIDDLKQKVELLLEKL